MGQVEKSRVEKVAEHFKKYLLAYTLVSMLLALVVGPRSFVVKMSNGDYSTLVQALAISTILPSAITLRREYLGRVLGMKKEIAIALLFAFVITPIIAWPLSTFISDKLLGLGFFLVNIIPGASAALGYVMLASGNIELAAALVLLYTILIFPVVPSYLTLYSSAIRVEIPIVDVVFSLAVVLLLPLIIGQIIKHYLVKYEYMKKATPYISLATMWSMLALVFVLISRKATVATSNPWFAVEIVLYYACSMAIAAFLLLLVDKALGIRYEEHQAIAFLVITKNPSIAAAIATSSLSGGIATLAPALVPAIQPVLAIAYLHLENYVKKILGEEAKPRGGSS